MSVYEELMKEGKQWEPDRRQTKSMRAKIRALKDALDKAKKEEEKKYTPTTRPKQSNVRKQISKSVKSSGWFSRKNPTTQHPELARVLPHEDRAALSKGSTRAVSWARSKRGTLTVAHTEYEGDPISELTGGGIPLAAGLLGMTAAVSPILRHKKIDPNYYEKRGRRGRKVRSHTEYEGPSLSEDGYLKKWKQPPRKKGAKQEVVPKRPNLTPEQLQDLLAHIRGRVAPTPPQQAAQGENASTEYEGPSIVEQLKYIKFALDESDVKRKGEKEKEEDKPATKSGDRLAAFIRRFGPWIRGEVDEEPPREDKPPIRRTSKEGVRGG